MTDDVTPNTKFALEEMFRVDERLSPDYEDGWNAAIAHVIEKFGGPSHLFHENEELGYKLDDTERRLADANERLAEAEKTLARERQFICKKCGLRQELGEKTEPSF